MTIDSIKLLHDAIGAAGKVDGFTKKGTSWYANRVDSVLVINPQKSQYGEQYYLNLGVFFHLLGTQSTPKERQCHLRTRLTELVEPEDQMRVKQLLDFEKPQLAEDRRRLELAALLETKGIPFLERCGTLDGARSALSQGMLDSMPISKKLRDLLQGEGTL